MSSLRYAIILASLTLATAAFVPRARHNTVQTTATTTPTFIPRDDGPAPVQCGFEGNADLYGLGIRLGIYFQWLSAQLCRVLHKEYVVELDRTYMIFLAAVFIALLVLTGDADSTYDVEVLVLMYILICGPFNFISGQLGEYRSIALVNVEFFVLWPATVYSSWFWFSGRDARFLQQPVECGGYGFVFKRVSLRGGSTLAFFKAMSVFLAIVLGLFHGLWFYVVPFKRWRKDRENNKPVIDSVMSWWGESKMEGREGGPTDRDDLTQHTFSKLYAAFCLVFPILGIELTLKWNSVRGVYGIRSIGQLIPFVTGLAGLIQAIYGIIRYKILARQAESPPQVTTPPDEAPKEAERESKQPAVSQSPQSESDGKGVTGG
ncbi:hypothetical protein C8A05DRAFT_35373 [Staphylotrichum tortipilum]|uniref:Uncharacterized protein n=1 Tax=Staphylotrichum tortipilum TaxID=2831512 RepID=A0AAN6MI39_9PEZI|nr:hypothetical protein C8A05DRAFT_35373 [Staphylotrichum longicolle]